MDTLKVVDNLEKNLDLFNTLLSNINENQAIWKPVPTKWSILEVVHHLYDEEREDFKLRLQNTLEDPEKEWVPINPPQWAIDRKYNEQNFNGTSNKFYKERRKSIDWLKNLQLPNWKNTHKHPSIGSISAGDLLVSWVAHDFLHMRQIVNLNLEYYQMKANPYNIKYALP